MEKEILEDIFDDDREIDLAGMRKELKIMPDKNFRSKDFQSRFLAGLVVKKQELEDTIEYLTNSRKEDMGKLTVDSFIDDVDRADREISTQTFYKILDRKKKELKKIDILINRVQQEQDFGLCEECGGRIPEERLLIIPEAVLCVPCQRELEKFESRTNITKISHNSSQWKKEFQIDSDEDFDDEGIVIKPNTDHVSFMDMEELELNDDQSEPFER